MKSSEYWEERALEREKYARKMAESTIKNKTVRYYALAKRDLDERIAKIFKTYSNNGGLTKKEAQELLSVSQTQAEINSLKKELLSIKDPEIRKKALAKINAGAYRARISRLEALKDNIEVQQAILAEREKRAIKSLLKDVCRDSYCRHIFDTQMGTGFAFDFSILPEKSINIIINEKFKGKNFSQRVWLNTNETAQKAYKIIAKGIITGESIPNMNKKLSEALSCEEYNSMRLIRTEVNRVHNAADIKAYEQEGTKEYIFLATLDKNTCELCGSMDGKIFELKKAKTGLNFPPLHPNDRCTTIEYLSKETLKGLKRRARDPQTGKISRIAADTTYSDWIKQTEENKEN